MPEQRSARNASPLVVALRLALEEALAARRDREHERAERRAKLRVVEPRRTEAA
jgi:hypothetical protein